MEEPVSWKGQTFTLLVFGGILVLCSIFFVLGMLVGRDQGQRIAQLAAAEAAKPPIAAQAEPEPLSFFEQTTKEKPQLDLLPLPPPAVKETPKQPEPPPESPTPQKYFLQILATKDAKAADRELTKVKSKGFGALILPPPPGGKDPQFRVHVGPYNSIAEADMAKKELQTLGYKGAYLK